MELDRLGRVLIGVGLLVVLAGGVLLLLAGLGIGRLPGDLTFRRGNLRVYVPIASSIVISIVLTLLVNLFLRR